MTITAEPIAQVAGFSPGDVLAGHRRPADLGASTEAPASGTAQSRLIPFLGCDEETRRRRAAGSGPPRPRPAR